MKFHYQTDHKVPDSNSKQQYILISVIGDIKKPFVHIDIGLLTDKVGESAPDTFNGRHSKHNLLLPINVGVQHTQNVLEVLVCNQRLRLHIKS